MGFRGNAPGPHTRPSGGRGEGGGGTAPTPPVKGLPPLASPLYKEKRGSRGR
ncbi:hypothetical protein KDAU_30290 [Dictyobacter aurantiacus]|uniref:Uncharacterized protein n=1 Tax=Dictyobacter aurantiacus TaxID=1936993 RepID=A0A401ZFN4_9CHLR|nr:hypothetical protein KDAU_30290 [Dictyobacter aurantiacus]